MTTFNFGWVPLIQQELRRFFATAEQGALADSALQPSPTIRRLGGVATNDFSSTGSFTLSANDSPLYYRNFTLNPGHTMTVDKFARIFCSGNVVIAGNVVVSPLAPGGKGLPYFDLTPGFASGYFEGYGPGQLRNTYSWQVAPHGSGGMGGYARALSANNALIRPGGFGGGGLIIDAGGTIIISGSAAANGQSASNAAIPAGNGIVAGAGGGSGGLLAFNSAVSITCSGTLSVIGGNGGNAANVGVTGIANGGESGGGGRVVLAAPAVNTTGATINLAAGVVGSPAGSGGVALGGGAGGSFGGPGGGYGLAAGVGHLRVMSVNPME